MNCDHPLVPTGDFKTAGDYCLHLMHIKAYETAVAFAAGKSVLDLGCNNGYGTALLAPHGAEVTGIDVSEGAIAEAHRRFAGQGAKFQVFDGRTIPFDADRFDLVVCYQVIEHVVDAGPFLEEIARVLRPGARALLTTPNAVIRLDPGMKPWNPHHVGEFTADGLENLVRPYFSHVSVRGMFATDAVYPVELQRGYANLIRARDPGAALAEPGLPRATRRLVGAVDGPPPDLERQITTNDYFYRDEDLFAALDLMAVCVTA